MAPDGCLRLRRRREGRAEGARTFLLLGSLRHRRYAQAMKHTASFRSSSFFIVAFRAHSDDESHLHRGRPWFAEHGQPAPSRYFAKRDLVTFTGMLAKVPRPRTAVRADYKIFLLCSLTQHRYRRRVGTLRPSTVDVLRPTDLHP